MSPTDWASAVVLDAAHPRRYGFDLPIASLFADDEPTRLRFTQATTPCRQTRGREAVEITASRA